MSILLKSLESKKANLESILAAIHSKNKSDVESYSSKELKRCGLLIKQIKSLSLQLAPALTIV